jgi:integrase
VSRRSKAKGDGLYKDKRSPYWQIDKEFAGARLRRSARTTDYGEAKAQVDVWVAAQKKALMIERLGLEPPKRPGDKPELTIDEAATRYFEEVGKTTKTADQTDMNLAWIVSNIAPDGKGKHTKLSEIDEPMLLALAARRRGEGSLRAKTWAALTEASINRYTLDIIRRLLRRAAITWKVNAATIDWGAIRTPENREGLFGREMPMAVEKNLYEGDDELRDDIKDFAEFLSVHGHRNGFTRAMEWIHVDFDAGVYRLRRKTRKLGDHFQEHPMTATARRLLLRQRGKHPKFVWTYKNQKKRGRWKVGDYRPLSETVMRNTLGKALKKLMGPKFRVHDMRHTAARRTLRKTKNLRAVQRVLGHADVATTAIYADVLHDEVRAAIEETEAAYNPRNNPGVIEGGSDEAAEVKDKKSA